MFHAKYLILGDWELKRPVWLLFLLYQLGESLLHHQNHTSPMLDVFLAQKAQDLGKKLHSIETPEEQCNPLHSVDEEQIVFALNYTLAYLEWVERRNAKMMEVINILVKYSILNFRKKSLKVKRPPESMS